MRECDVCTLVHPHELCPNGWRDAPGGEKRQREPGKHQAARAHVEWYRTAQAAIRR